jgi:hypothetical protein
VRYHWIEVLTFGFLGSESGPPVVGIHDNSTAGITSSNSLAYATAVAAASLPYLVGVGIVADALDDHAEEMVHQARSVKFALRQSVANLVIFR